MNDVKEAAERLLEEFEVHSSCIARDACAVAEAYLAEHPADDECNLTRLELIRRNRILSQTVADIKVFCDCTRTEASSNRYCRDQITKAVNSVEVVIEDRWEVVPARADDSEPVTAEWLEAVGLYGEYNLGWGFSLQFHTCGVVELICKLNDQRETLSLDCKTRGDVRRLASALGIELKESGDEVRTDQS